MTTTQALTRLREVLRRQHKALATEDAYVHWLRRYIEALRRMPPPWPSERKLEQFLSDLALHRHVAASTQNQAFNAIVFFYHDVLGTPLREVDALRAKRPVHLRYAPTIAETHALLQAVRDQPSFPNGLVARLLYGCGLRVSEPLNVRVRDLDLPGARVVIRGAKGGKDRVVALPSSLLGPLAEQLETARRVWTCDQRNRVPLALPHALARKYPAYQYAWPWAWVFPAQRPCRDPRSGLIVRYRLHEANVQRAIREAGRRLGLTILPHELRHAYATHCLARGANPRAIQAAMGHECLETTMGYFHAESLSVASPLDMVPADVRIEPGEDVPRSSPMTGSPPCRGTRPGYASVAFRPQRGMEPVPGDCPAAPLARPTAPRTPIRPRSA